MHVIHRHEPLSFFSWCFLLALTSVFWCCFAGARQANSCQIQYCISSQKVLGFREKQEKLGGEKNICARFYITCLNEIHTCEGKRCLLEVLVWLHLLRHHSCLSLSLPFTTIPWTHISPRFDLNFFFYPPLIIIWLFPPLSYYSSSPPLFDFLPPISPHQRSEGEISIRWLYGGHLLSQ